MQVVKKIAYLAYIIIISLIPMQATPAPCSMLHKEKKIGSV